MSYFCYALSFEHIKGIFTDLIPALLPWLLPEFLVQLFLYIVTIKMTRKKLRFAIRRIPLFAAMIHAVVDALLVLNVFNLAEILDINDGKFFGHDFESAMYWNVAFPFVVASWLLAWCIYLIINKIYRKKHPYALEPDVKKYEKPIGGIHSDADAK